MSQQTRRQSFRLTLPIIDFIISEWKVWHIEQAKPRFSLGPISCDDSDLPPYPLDMEPLLALPHGTLDEAGVPYNAATKKHPAAYQPTTIAQYGLANWNVYLATRDDKYKQAFMTQAHWLVAHESEIGDDMGGWPHPFPLLHYYTSGPWLSALTQGNGISVLVRANRLTGKPIFLEVARRAVRTFEVDILNGGVRASVGDNGVFFEEVAAYPAAHILNGYILALFGLYDYVALTEDEQIAALIQRSLATLHTLIDEFDTGYWSRYDLLFKRLAPPFYHALHVTILKILAQYSGCRHCAALEARWDRYQHSRSFQIRYFIASRFARYRYGLQHVFSRMSNVGADHATVMGSKVPTHTFR